MTERERLIEILSTTIYPRIGANPAEVVADFLLDNGVIVPPCNIGDEFFFIRGTTIKKSRCHAFKKDLIDGLIIVDDLNKRHIADCTFATYEEAELFLKEIESNG